MQKIEDIITWIKIKLGLLQEEVTRIDTPFFPAITPSEHLYNTARSFIGVDASPQDRADDEVGCAESVSYILQAAFGDFPLEIELATWILHDKLKKHPKFQATLDLGLGHIIICPTGKGNGSMRGHVGVLGEDGKIMSSNSANGLWEENYTIKTWVERYRDKGGFPIYVFKRSSY